MGVRCERSHGPVAERIFHPGKLEPFAQVQMCGACHGRPPHDNDFDAIRYVGTTLKTVRFPSQRLVPRRCFNGSIAGLKRATCHDLHTNATAEGESHGRPRLSRHPREGASDASICPKEADVGASCHVPQERVISHSLCTEHWIRGIRNAGN